jgi:hypothetical protein
LWFSDRGSLFTLSGVHFRAMQRNAHVKELPDIRAAGDERVARQPTLNHDLGLVILTLVGDRARKLIQIAPKK